MQDEGEVFQETSNDQWLIINTVLLMGLILFLSVIAFVAGLFRTLSQLVRLETSPLFFDDSYTLEKNSGFFQSRGVQSVADEKEKQVQSR